MVARYGALWLNSHGDRPGKMDMGEWGELLDVVTDDQIRDGFAADMRRASDFPPSSAAFRALCLGISDGDDVPLSRRPGAQMYQPIAPRGARIEAERSREAAGRELEKMRKTLGISQ